MYAFLRAIFDALLSWCGSNAGKGTLGVDGKRDEEKLRKAGSRIREYLRLRGVQPSDPDSRVESDSDR